MKYKHLATCQVALSLFLVSMQISAAFAAEDVMLAHDGGLEVSITANRRLADDATQSLSAVTVIDRTVIENSQASDLTELLRQVPGLTFQNSGGAGKATSIHLRGSNASHVLVLVDGIKIGSATLGSVAFQDIPLENIERIEVVRGPRSALYGSEAIGGVIQIFTQQGKEGFHPQLTLGVGSHQLRKLNINLSGKKGKSWYAFNAGSEKTDGFDARYLSFGQPDVETDNDGYRREQLSLGLGHQLVTGTTLQLNVQQVKGDNDFDGSGDDHTRYKRQVMSSKIQMPLGEKTKIMLQLGQSKDESDNSSSGFSRVFNTRRDIATLQLETEISRSGVLIAGVDWQKERVDTTTAYSKNSRKNTGIFTSYQNRFNKLDIEASLRQDDNEQFGSETTGNFAVGYRLNHGIRLVTSYESAFKAPSFNDLYYPEDQYSLGNPDIKAESSNNIEFSIQGTMDSGRWEINLFQNRVDNLISWGPRTDGKWTPSNVDKAKIEGLEASYKTKLGNWQFNTALGLLSAKNDRGINQGKYLPYRPKRTLNLDFNRDFARWNMGATLHAESARYTTQDNHDRLAGYATLDLRAEYALAKSWRMGLKVANVLDKKYETNKGYHQDGTNGLLTLRYTPK